jgi:hypothetical protein
VSLSTIAVFTAFPVQANAIHYTMNFTGGSLLPTAGAWKGFAFDWTLAANSPLAAGTCTASYPLRGIEPQPAMPDKSKRHLV